MPYRRTYGKKKPYRSAAKKTYKRKSTTNYGAAALNAIKGFALKKLKQKLGLNTESKFFDATISGQVATTTLALACDPHDLLAQGNTTSTRNGDSVRLTHFRMKGHVTHNTLDAAATQTRILVTYQPEAPGASILAAASMLQNTSLINSPYAQNLAGLVVLYDEILITDAQDTVARFEFDYHPLDHHLRWTTGDTTGAAANMNRGPMKVFIMTTSASNAPNVTAYIRSYFVDN